LNGAGNSTFRLCKNLNKKKYKISIISLGKNSHRTNLKKIGCNVYELKSKSVLSAMFKIYPLVKKIYKNTNNKNIFISAHHHTNIFSIIFLRSLKNIKIIGIERTDISELLIFENMLTYTKNLIIYFLVKIFYKKADLIISNSKSGRKDLSQLCKTRVINISSPSYKSVVKKKKINAKELKLIAVGRLAKEKGYKTIIKALYNLKIKNYSMKILGDGPEKKKLKKMIRNFNLEKKIKLIGFKKDTAKYYNEANLFINTSLFEGFPNAVVEAINHNTPVICSNCKGGMNEILLNGKGGDLFPVNDFEALSKKITSFYKNPRKLKNKLAIARKNIKNYSVSAHVKKYEKVFYRI
jgi:glycosyltransferase involved in cell wall biosynthesis